LSFLEPFREQIQLGKRAATTLHLLRRSYAADGKASQVQETEDIIKQVDELVTATKKLKIH
jgi:hypothetical protein